MKKWKKYITFLLPLLSVLVLFLVGEIGVRTWHFFRWDISFFEGQPTKVTGLSPIAMDPRLGWRATENYRFSGIRRTLEGVEYPVTVTQDSHGFRMFGDLASARPKVLVIGDSFTEAVEASDDKTYFSVMKRSFDIEVFAYGGGGYGTLQEYMILDKYYDLIKPDLIIWQYSTNDLINNSAELETASTMNNNGVVRPYLTDDSISYILPKRHARDLRLLALRYCRLCYLVQNRVDRLNAMMPQHHVELETGPGQPANALFVKSLAVTDHIMGMARDRAGSIPIVAFMVGAGYPYGPEYAEGFSEVSRHHDILLLNEVENAVLTAEKNGTRVRASDGAHWNETGHQIAGQALADALRSKGLPGSR